MVSLGQRVKPYRSKMFMAFCHEEMKPAPCALCGERPWTQLHHWGDDGGTGMKPNDQQLVRLCKPCHDQWGMKRRALIRHDQMIRLRVFTEDALKLNMAYVQHLEGKRTSTGCARDELEYKFSTGNGWMSSETRKNVEWLMQWADRRAVELFDAIDES